MRKKKKRALNIALKLTGGEEMVLVLKHNYGEIRRRVRVVEIVNERLAYVEYLDGTAGVVCTEPHRGLADRRDLQPLPRK